MALQYSVAVRNAKLDQVETVTGASARLRISTGAPPANAAAVDTGTMLVDMALPADWMAAAAAGVKGKLGTWQGTGDAGAGAGLDAGHFRIKDSTGTTVHIQGTAGETLDTPDLVLDNKNVASGQTVTITQFDITAGNG